MEQLLFPVFTAGEIIYGQVRRQTQSQNARCGRDMIGIWVRVGALSFCPHSPLNKTAGDTFPRSPSFVIMDQLPRQRVSWLFTLWGWSDRESTWWNAKGWAPMGVRGKLQGILLGLPQKGNPIPSCILNVTEGEQEAIWRGDEQMGSEPDGCLWVLLRHLLVQTLDKSHLLGRSWQHPLQVV